MILEVEKNGKKRPKLKKAAEVDEGSPKAAKKKLPKDKPHIVIDFPEDGELILEPRHYAVRMGASLGPVEISIDAAGWQTCREAGGYFWFDWSQIPSGSHSLLARAKTGEGKFVKSKIVKCKVK